MSLFHFVNSVDERHSFSSLNVSFGFTGKSLPIKKENYYFLKQTHSTDHVRACDQNNNLYTGDRTQGDAIYTLDKKIVAVKTADCLPILVTDLDCQYTIAIHAGWRGLSSGIIERSLSSINKNYNIPLDQMVVFMGPCISFDFFEIGPEVLNIFEKKSFNLMSASSFSSCYKKGKGDRYFFSLRYYAFFSLKNLGVKETNISALNTCTYLKAKLWYSYRRSKILHGTNWSWIGQQ